MSTCLQVVYRCRVGRCIVCARARPRRPRLMWQVCSAEASRRKPQQPSCALKAGERLPRHVFMSSCHLHRFAYGHSQPNRWPFFGMDAQPCPHVGIWIPPKGILCAAEPHRLLAHVRYWSMCSARAYMYSATVLISLRNSLYLISLRNRWSYSPNYSPRQLWELLQE